MPLHLNQCAVVAAVAALLASATPSALAAPAATPGFVQPTASTSPPVSPAGVPAVIAAPGREIGLGSLQLVVAYGAELGGLVGLDALDLRPKDFGFQSDYANLVMVAALVPILAGTAVCTTGYLSRSYRGRCSTTFLGAYAGAALGLVLGLAVAPSPGPDDTWEFTRTMSGLVGVFLLTPVGAVIGYHAGKQPIDHGTAQQSAKDSAQETTLAFASPPLVDETATAFTPQRLRLAFATAAPRSLMLPVITFNW